MWTVNEKGEATTQWIAWSADGYRQVAETEGALIAVGPEVWRWGTVAHRVKTTKCDNFATPPGEGAAVQGFVERIGAWGRDEVSMVLDEAYKFSCEVLGPINAVGDRDRAQRRSHHD